MSPMVIEIDFHMCDYSRVTVVIDWMREKVVREPTPLERATCPPEFTCYACGEHRRKDDLAGEVLKQRICRFCSPYVDEWQVGFWIRFDQRRGFRSFIRDY